MLSLSASRLALSAPALASKVAPVMSCAAVRGKATLPDLPYDYGALEPVISAEIMQLHHSKHHQTYVNNFNAASEKLQEASAKGRLCFLQMAICTSFDY